MSDKFGREYFNPLQGTLFICLQHCLLTTIPLFQSLFKIGANPKNIFLLGKNYSNSKQADNIFKTLGINYFEPSPLKKTGCFQENLSADIKLIIKLALDYARRKKIKNIILLDDGGRLIDNIQLQNISEFQLFGIEQTSKGIEVANMLPRLPFPIINVARSAVKKKLESPEIAKTIIKKADKFIQKYSEKKFGIIGLGCIGRQIAAILKERVGKYVFYDKSELLLDKEDLCWRNSITDVFTESEIIFGCTGNDVTKDIDFSRVFTKDMVLVSCSSEDIEFSSLLDYLSNKVECSSTAVFCDINYQFGQAHVTIKNGGFPINFDNSGISVPYIDIQLTRSLMLCAVIQVANYYKYNLTIPNAFIALDAKMQSDTAKTWLKMKGLSTATILSYARYEVIKASSEGEICKILKLIIV